MDLFVSEIKKEWEYCVDTGYPQIRIVKFKAKLKSLCFIFRCAKQMWLG